MPGFYILHILLKNDQICVEVVIIHEFKQAQLWGYKLAGLYIHTAHNPMNGGINTHFVHKLTFLKRCGINS